MFERNQLVSPFTISRSDTFTLCFEAAHNTGAARTCIISLDHPSGAEFDGSLTINQAAGDSQVPTIERYVSGYLQDPIDDLQFELDLANAQRTVVSSVVFQYGIGNFDNSVTAATTQIGQTRQYTADVLNPPDGVYQTRAIVTYANGTLTSQQVDVTVTN